MGQTLSHGVYLPAEGERNCYSGLASNWNLLDTAIGDTAGKASATHTHGNISSDGKVGTTANLPLITGTDGVVQAGSFGNSANTFCEGNDSRLSDARTPVAHTHTKSDVTDLFNSDNTWSGNNTYTATINYQSSYTLGNPPQSVASQIAVKVADTAGTNYLAQISTYQDTATTGLRFTIRDKFDSNGFSPSGSNRNKYLSFLQNTSNQGYLQWDGYVNNSIAPLANNSYDLGTSTNKWKTLNGVNPGALSLPRIVQADSRTLDTTNWDYTGTNWNTLDTSAMTGWGYIYIADCSATDFILIRRGTTNAERPTQSTNPILDNNGKYYLYITFPIVQNTNVYALIRTSGTVTTAVVYPCQGNV